MKQFLKPLAGVISAISSPTVSMTRLPKIHNPKTIPKHPYALKRFYFDQIIFHIENGRENN